jgi:hypothetical protein
MEMAFKLKGVTFNNKQQLIQQLQPGQGVVFCKEPSNPADSNAVAVYTAGMQQLGYIPKHAAAQHWPLQVSPRGGGGGGRGAAASVCTQGRGASVRWRSLCLCVVSGVEGQRESSALCAWGSAFGVGVQSLRQLQAVPSVLHFVQQPHQL